MNETSGYETIYSVDEPMGYKAAMEALSTILAKCDAGGRASLTLCIGRETLSAMQRDHILSKNPVPLHSIRGCAILSWRMVVMTNREGVGMLTRPRLMLPHLLRGYRYNLATGRPAYFPL